MEISSRTRTIALSVSAVLAAGCASMDKEQIGTVVGAVAGGIIGHKLGGRSGAAIGALIGGAFGNRLGAHLDEEDRKKLAELERRALETGEGGSFVTNKTKATVSVSVAPATIEAKKPFVLSESVTPHTVVLIDPLETTAYVETPVYTTLDEKLPPRLVIRKGVAFSVAASVQDKPWGVVGDSNVGIGYVPLRYLAPSIASDPSRYKAPVVAARTAAKPPTQTAQAKTAPGGKPATATAANPPPSQTTNLTSKAEYDRELSRLQAAYPAPSSSTTASAAVPTQPAAAGGQAAIASASPPTPQVVQANTECKVVVRKVDAGSAGSAISESIKYCKEPPSGWQTVVT